MMQIKEAAMYLNTTPKAIRFYETKGLITPRKDEGNQYRYFSESDLYRLSTILALREIGVAVQDIKTILEDPNLSIRQYLDIQRSALFEQWLEMRDMIETIDEMLEQNWKNDSIEAIHQLAAHLKNMKEIRGKWQDRWDFNEQAKDYDNHIKREGHVFNVHEGYDEGLQAVVEKVKLGSCSVVADIGIGTGNLGAKFLPNHKVIGVDQSEKMLKKCKEKHPTIETRNGHFLALPLLDQSVDAIVSSYALHHLPDEEKLLALKEMKRVLKPNGQIGIVDLMFQDEIHRKNVLNQFRKAGNQIAVDSIEDEYYANQSLLVEWLKQNGYKVEAIQINRILGLIYAYS